MDNLLLYGILAWILFLIVDLLWLGYLLGSLEVKSKWLKDVMEERDVFYNDYRELVGQEDCECDAS